MVSSNLNSFYCIYKISSSRPLCSQREFCNRPFLLAPSCWWITIIPRSNRLQATSRSTLMAVPQLGRGKRLWTRLALTVLPQVQLPPLSEYAGDHHSSSSRSGKREHQPLPPQPPAKPGPSPQPKLEPFALWLQQAEVLLLPSAAGLRRHARKSLRRSCCRPNLSAATAERQSLRRQTAAAPRCAAVAAGNPDASGAALQGQLMST